MTSFALALLLILTSFSTGQAPSNFHHPDDYDNDDDDGDINKVNISIIELLSAWL